MLSQITRLTAALILCGPHLYASRILEKVPNPTGFSHWERYGVPDGAMQLWLDRHQYHAGPQTRAHALIQLPRNTPSSSTLVVTLDGSDEELLPCDGDVTSLGVVMDLSDLPLGEHVLRAEIGPHSSEWKFTVSEPPAPERVFPIELTALDDFEKKPGSAYAGIPLPKGLVQSVKELVLKDEKENRIPADIIERSRWHDSSTLRWIGVRFHADGKPVFLHRSDASARETQPMAVNRDGRWTVTTDQHRFTIDASSGAGLKSISDKATGRTIVTGRGAVLQSAWSGKIFQSANDKTPTIRLIDSGDEAVTLAVSARFVAKDGESDGRAELFYTFYRQSPDVSVRFDWINTKDTNEAAYRFIGYDFQVPDLEPKIGFSDSGGKKHRTTADLQLVQDDFDRYVVAEEGKYVTKTGALSGAFELRAADRPLEVRVAELRERFPRGLKIADGLLRLYIWPEKEWTTPYGFDEKEMFHFPWLHKGKDLNFTVPAELLSFENSNRTNIKHNIYRASQANSLGVRQGVSFTLALKPEAGAEADPKAYGRTRIYRASPQLYASNGTAGPLQIEDYPHNKESEAFIEGLHQSEITLNRSYFKDYGAFIYGGIHDAFRPDLGTWDLQRAWHSHSREKQRVPWLLYMRSGRIDYFLEGLIAAEHAFNYYVWHSSDYWIEGFDLGDKGNPYYRKYPGAHPGVRGFVPWWGGTSFSINGALEYMFLHHFLTGEQKGLDTAELAWAGLKRFTSGIPHSSREGAGLMNAAMDYYANTSPDYAAIPFIHETFRTIAAEFDPKSFTFASNWQNYTDWLGRYYCTTGSPEARKLILDWADGLLSIQDADFTSGINAYVNVLAHAWQITGDLRFREHLLGIVDEERHSVFDHRNPLFKGFYLSPSTTLASYLKQRLPMMPGQIPGEERLQARYTASGTIAARPSGQTYHFEAFARAGQEGLTLVPTRKVRAGELKPAKGVLRIYEGEEVAFEKEVALNRLRSGETLEINFPDAISGHVYRIGITSKAPFEVAVPITKEGQEVYTWRFYPDESRGALLPRVTIGVKGEPGAFSIHCIPSFYDSPFYFYDHEEKLLGSYVKADFPRQVELTENRPLTIKMNRYGWRTGAHRILLSGPEQELFFSVEPKRFFIPRDL